MPTYATVEDVQKTVSKELLVQMTDDDNNGQVDKKVVENAIDQAEGIVNAAISRAGYDTPIATPIPAGAEIINGATVWLGI